MSNVHGLLSRSRFQSALLGNSNHSVMYTPAVYHMCTALISAVCRDIFCRPQRCSDAFASRKALLKKFDLQFISLQQFDPIKHMHVPKQTFQVPCGLHLMSHI